MTNSENPQDNDQVFALEIEEENVRPQNIILIIVYALCTLGVVFILFHELLKYSGLSNKRAACLFVSEEFFLPSRLLESKYQKVKKRDGRNPYLVPYAYSIHHVY